MKTEVVNLIHKLRKENELGSKKLNSKISDYEHTVLVHTYNYTLEIIKQLEEIINNRP